MDITLLLTHEEAQALLLAVKLAGRSIEDTRRRKIYKLIVESLEEVLKIKVEEEEPIENNIKVVGNSNG